MWQPWVGSWFPVFTPDAMGELTLYQYVAMEAYVERSLEAAEA